MKNQRVFFLLNNQIKESIVGYLHTETGREDQKSNLYNLYYRKLLSVGMQLQHKLFLKPEWRCGNMTPV